MHPYATDSNEHRLVVGTLALLSVIGMWIFQWGCTRLSITLPWWIEAPSVMGLFGLFITIFDRNVWRWSLLRVLGIVKVPVLACSWEGNVISSHDQHECPIPAKVKIIQTWTHILLAFETENSESKSISASIFLDRDRVPTLNYEYQNQPKAASAPTMHIHQGTACLKLKNDESLEGEYYTGRDRQSYGYVKLTRSTAKP